MTSSDKEIQDVPFGIWAMKTRNGFAADECISALTKSVRRGLVDDAVFWANELNHSGLGAWTWRRILVQVSEEVGIAEPLAPAVIAGLWTASQVLLAAQPKPVPPDKVLYPELQLLQAVWYLARCPKNRELADMATLFEVRAQRNVLLEVPDYALDKHTARGRAMGRDARHFEDDSPSGARWVDNEVEIDGNRWKKMFYEEWIVPPPGSRRSVPPGSQKPRVAAKSDAGAD